ncbi:MAG: HEAT repeat domain-containing protein [Planctomycetes bacterium]|nr:HEAT repeat domain-containing protein [Planctomycetota bacterium]
MGNKTALVGLWVAIGFIGALAVYFYYATPKASAKLPAPQPSVNQPAAVTATPATALSPVPSPLPTPKTRPVLPARPSQPSVIISETTPVTSTIAADKLAVKIAEWEKKYPRLFTAHPELKELLSNPLWYEWGKLRQILIEELQNGSLEIYIYFMGVGSISYDTPIHTALSENKAILINDLSGFLSHPAPEMRRGSLVVLELIAAKEMIPIAINLLSDSDTGVCKAAISYLGAVGAQEARYKIAECLTDDAHHEVRGAAIYALGLLGAKESIPKLICSLSDEQGYILATTIRSLGELDAKEAIPQIRNSLNDSDKEVRLATILTLARLGDKESIPYTVTMLSDTDFEQCLVALNALRALNAKEAIPDIRKLLDSPNRMIREAAQELIQDIEPK